MDTATFLKRVVAATDNIVISVLKPGLTRKEDIFYNCANCGTTADAIKTIKEWDAKPEWTTYFAVGTHKDNEEAKPNGKTKILRRQATATWFKAFALDLDIGHDKGSPYATQKEGMNALIAALKTFDFPDPMVVNSGKGIHCYWPLDNEIPRDTWVEHSIELRMALRDGGVVIDESKIHDASMVLRPAGSHHKKGTPWVEVKVVFECPDYKLEDLTAKLLPWKGKKPPRKVATQQSSAPSASKKPSAISAAILSGGYDPVNLPSLIAGCRQLAALAASRGLTDVMGNLVREPMWRNTLGVCAYCTDPQQAIIDLCSGHADYDLQDNLDKLSRWKGSGVTLCESFDKACPGGCNGCAEKGKINSPYALNRITAFHIAKIDPDPLSENEIPEDIPVLPMPEGYYGSGGKVWMDVEVEKTVQDSEGKKQKVVVKEKKLVSMYPIVVLDRYRSQDYEKSTVLWATRFPGVGHWQSFEMPADILMSTAGDITKYFGNKQIFVHDEAVIGRTRRYMIDFVKHIQNNRPTGMDVESFGWQSDGSFLAGDKLIQPGGNHGSWRHVKTLKRLSERVGSKGNKQAWSNMTSVLDDPCAHHIGFSMLVAGCGLLLQGSGIQSFIYSLWSPETGTGKTLALLFGNSLFGHPTQNLLSPADTNNALYQVMGSLGSYSASMDEVTQMSQDRAVEFAFVAQTGREKLSLTQGRELREGTEWHSPLRLTTNTSLYYMYDLYKNKNEGEKVRTLEVQVDNKDFINKYDVQVMIRELEDNYGFAAPDLAEEIMRRGGVRKVYDHYQTLFPTVFTQFKFEKDERFYAGGIIASWAIGKILEDLNLIQYDVDECTKWILKRVEQLRNIRMGARLDCFDIVGQYLADYNNQIIVSKDDGGSKPVIQMPIPDLAAARVELVFDKAHLLQHGSKLMLSVGKLKEWAKKSREDVNNLVESLKNSGALLNEKERVTMFKGTHHNNPGQAYCIVLNLLHPRFAGVIASNKAIIPTNPTLALLQGGQKP